MATIFAVTKTSASANRWLAAKTVANRLNSAYPRFWFLAFTARLIK
jgi:hypothetical protein